MANNKNRKRPQKQKDNVRRVQELRQGSTTSPHRSGSDYRRKDKYPRQSWGD
jgi:hypothetical protein